MPPKKSVPLPQSDESESDEDVKKSPKKHSKSSKRGKEVPKDPEEELQKAATEMFNESEVEDDNTDLFSLQLPAKPDFLTKSNRADRLMILNVEVNNFKSYYGKASIGPFHKSFTSIIGPNGSGKSNLIDALLFVFGFRASKIRSAKVSNLIHKSAGREPDSCSVTIHFQRILDTNGNYEVVKDSEFTISRTAFKNSSSSYAIDGRAASKSEVEARLRLVDIDIEHNRFLILQGEVEQIAMMKPVKTTKSETGMVEYLEDIIGSNRLERFVKLFQHRVNRLTCELSQQRISRDHARNSKAAMEGPVRSAIEFLNKENEAKTIQMKLDSRRRLRYLDKVSPKQAELEAKKAEMKVIAEQLDANKNEYNNAGEAEKKLNKDRSKIDKEIDQLTKELNDLSAEATRRKETIKRYASDVVKIEAEKEKEVKKRAYLETVPEKAEKKIANWREEIEQLTEIENTANLEADRNLEEFEKRAEKPKEEQKKVQEAWAKQNAEFNKVRSEATVARDEFEDMKKAATSGKNKLKELNDRLISAEIKHDKEKKEMEAIKTEFDSYNEKMKHLSSELPTVRNSARQKNHEYAQSREHLETLRQQNSSCTSSDKVIQALMKAKQDGRIPSFIGRLGDLGVVDPKYDASISTNFFSRLNYLIVGKEIDARNVLNFLYENKLPRYTVQPLDKIKKNSQELEPALSGRYPAPRLYDLIECEPELKPAFYDMLKNSIIADTTDIAHKYHKSPACRGVTVCTLQGAMIHPSGNFTGGGMPLRGYIATDRSKRTKQVTAEDRAAEKELEVKVEKLRKEADELKERERQLDKQLFETRGKVNELNNRLSVVTASVQSDGPAIETLKKTIDVQEREASKVKVDAKELEEKENVAIELEKKRDQLSEEAEKVKACQAEIQSKLDSIFGELVQCHRDDAKEALQKRQKLEKEMAKETANVSNSGRNIAKCDDNIARFEKDILKKRKLCAELQEKAIDEEVVEEKKGALEEMVTKRKELEQEIGTVTKKQSELSAAETKLEDDLKKCSGEVMELKEGMAADELKVKEIEKRLSGLRINRIPRFQFLTQSTRPEDLEMQIGEKMPVVDENLSPEEIERQKKHMACVMRDAAYALEFGMRQKVLENTESYENVEGEKLVAIELLTDEQVREITSRDAEELQFKLKQCEQQLEALKAKVDLSVIDTYVNKVKLYNEEVIKLTIVTEEHRKHNTELQRIKQMRLEEFHSAFEFIGKHLVAVYKMLTDGGDAKLEYIDKDDPFLHGISFMVRPAKKAWKQIQFLSGGEKTLSSLALIFALHMFRPTPFYVMDEIDAALDYRNVSIIAQYVRQKTENAQFIIISLRNNMFELANRLVGIYKVEGCTRNVAIDPQKVCEMAKQISDSLGQVTCTLPDEVSQRFNETINRQNKEMTAQEKQYPHFPSSSEISKAEKIVSVEGRVRKELNHKNALSRPQSKVMTTKNVMEKSSGRPDSRLHQMKIPVPRLVERSASQSTRTPRKERNNEDDDETTPPAKRSNSTTTRSPRKLVSSTEKHKRDSKGETVE